MPGNALLPTHQGQVITRGLQEWACLLPQDLPFETVARLLGWQADQSQLLCATTLRSLVRQHGRLISQAYQAEVEALLAQPEVTGLQPQVVAHTSARYRAGWPKALSGAVEQALAEANPQPPAGVSVADWERVLAARRQESDLSVEALRRLGPQLEAQQVLVSVDEVLTRQVQPGCFWEIRTARLMTATGYRYLTGVGDGFCQLLLVFILLCLGSTNRSVLLLADGAKWIRHFYLRLQAQVAQSQLILDWFHLHKRCYEFSTMICAGKKARTDLSKQLYYRLWRGQTEAAIELLVEYRSQTKNETKLAEFITYLRGRQPFIPDYQARRRQRLYIGSGQAEKTNDLIVTRRQKHQGMRWSLQTSQALATLKTLRLNQGWQLYWQQRQVLPLLAVSA